MPSKRENVIATMKLLRASQRQSKTGEGEHTYNNHKTAVDSDIPMLRTCSGQALAEYVNSTGPSPATAGKADSQWMRPKPKDARRGWMSLALDCEKMVEE